MGRYNYNPTYEALDDLAPDFDSRDLPIIGPWISKVGRIQQIQAIPCGPTVDVWVQAAWIALPKLVTSFIKPDPIDSVQRRGKRPHRRRRHYRWHRPDIWDPSAWWSVGEGLPLPKGKLAWVLFRVSGYGQAAAFTAMVIDANLDFLINWTSLAFTISGCGGDGIDGLKAQSYPDDLHPPTGNWHPIFWDPVYQTPGWFGTNAAVIPQGKQGLVACSLTAQRWDNPVNAPEFTFSARLYNSTTGKITMLGEGGSGDAERPVAFTGLTNERTLNGATQFIFPEIKVEGAYVTVNGSWLTATEVPSLANPWADP